MIADDLRRQADVFMDLRELQPSIGRDPKRHFDSDSLEVR
jgi:uncharacterized LabA/DUF88 family protein